MLTSSRACALLLAFLMVLASTAIPSAAVAQDPGVRAEVMRLVKDANASYNAAKFREALKGYLEAYELAKEEALLYRVGQCYESLGNYQRAREYLNLFILSDPDNKRATRIRAKISQLEKLEKQLQARVAVASEPAGATVFIDGIKKPEGLTPLTVPIGSGSHQVVAKLDGYEPMIVEVEAQQGRTVRKLFKFKEGITEDQSDTGDEPDKGDEPDEPKDPKEPLKTTPTPPIEVTEVDIAPPTVVSILGWAGIVAGNVLLFITFSDLVTSSSVAGEENNTMPLLTGLGGLALLGVSGYFMFFFDWSGSLPDVQQAEAANTMLPQGADAFRVGLRWRF